MLFLAKRNRPKQAFSEAALDAVPENAMRRWRRAEENDLNGRCLFRSTSKREEADLIFVKKRLSGGYYYVSL